MGITREQAINCFASDDLSGIGMEADAVRRRLHPEGVVSYIIDRNINYTNFCTEYCTFCTFYRPLKGKLASCERKRKFVHASTVVVRFEITIERDAWKHADFHDLFGVSRNHRDASSKQV